jgi:hypothetical protein
MTNEEFNLRMDRLSERHEALSQSVESLHHDLVELKEVVEKNAAQTAANTEVAKILLKVVESHQHRIGRLEEGQS